MLILGINSFSQSINHWETIIKTGDFYNYNISAIDFDYDDSFFVYLISKEVSQNNLESPVILINSNLPVMIINTNGQTIPDEPQIIADMGLIFNGEGKTNSESDNRNEYSGKISIERRGVSSLGSPKKSYSIELQKEDGSNNNVSILGLPAENDFVLYGPYSDKTLMKNVLSYELFRLTGRWAPHTRYIEVILNLETTGVFMC